MDKETKLEAKLRTLKLDSYDIATAQHDAAELAFIRLYRQTHEQRNGRRVKLTKRRKIAKYRETLKRIFSENLDVSRDAINQLRVMDSDE